MIAGSQGSFISVSLMPHLMRVCKDCRIEQPKQSQLTKCFAGKCAMPETTAVLLSVELSECVIDCARDVFNEQPTTEDMLAAGGAGVSEGQEGALPRTAVIHSTRGDIHVKLFPEQCPKTVENWTTHSRNGHYDGVIFHRVIMGFMLQTGHPLGEPCFTIALAPIHHVVAELSHC